jgi:hypothetical protein
MSFGRPTLNFTFNPTNRQMDYRAGARLVLQTMILEFGTKRNNHANARKLVQRSGVEYGDWIRCLRHSSTVDFPAHWRSGYFLPEPEDQRMHGNRFPHQILRGEKVVQQIGG